MIHDNEVLGPEHLVELGAVFDKTWSTFKSFAISELDSGERARLACILLRLYNLRQLSPDQLAKSALRLMTGSSRIEMTVSATESIDAPSESASTSSVAPSITTLGCGM